MQGDVYLSRNKINTMIIPIKKLKSHLIICAIASGLYGCVPAKQLEDLQKKDKICQDDNNRLKDENHALLTENTELKESVAEMQKNISAGYYHPDRFYLSFSNLQAVLQEHKHKDRMLWRK